MFATQPGPDGPAAETLERIRQIPHEHRDFSVSAATAHRDYRIPPRLLGELVDRGLPCRQSGDSLTFDHIDLLNLSMDLGLSSVWMVAMRWWPRALARTEARPVRCLVRYACRCPVPEHRGACTFEVLVPEQGWIAEDLPDGRRNAVLRISTVFELPARWPPLPVDLAAVANEISQLRFTRLPRTLRWDTEFISRTGMADCAGATQLLLAGARRLGYPARFSFGLILAPPFSSTHCWAEVNVDGCWVPVDPLTMSALQRWRLIDAATAQAHCSPRGILGRLAGTAELLARHNGDRAEVSLLTSYLPEPDGGNLVRPGSAGR